MRPHARSRFPRRILPASAVLLCAGMLFTSAACAADQAPPGDAKPAPAAAPAGAAAAGEGKWVDKLPHIQFNVAQRKVRVECEALNVNAPLEFFCVLAGTSE